MPSLLMVGFGGPARAGLRVSFGLWPMDLEKVNLLRRDAQAADLDELAGLVRLDTLRLSIR